MFFLTLFNQPLGLWDVQSVQNMKNMFAGYVDNNASLAVKSWFNQPIGSWNVSSVTNMEGLLINAQDFSQALDSWDVASVKTMSRTFNGAAIFDQTLNSWDVSGVTDMVRVRSSYCVIISFRLWLLTCWQFLLLNCDNHYSSAFLRTARTTRKVWAAGMCRPCCPWGTILLCCAVSRKKKSPSISNCLFLKF